jgi:hypothetical protein
MTTTKRVGRPPKAKDDNVAKKENSHSNTNQLSSTSQARRLGRIKRDHPELAERIAAGEFKSVSETEWSGEDANIHTFYTSSRLLIGGPGWNIIKMYYCTPG